MRRFSGGVRECWYARDGNVAKKLQRQMQVVLATPARSHIGTLAPKTINVIRNFCANVRRDFDGDESSKSIHRLHRLHRWEIGHKKAQDAQTENRS